MEDKEVFYEQLERLVIVLDEIMPGCATLVRDAIATLKEQESTINELQNAYGYLQKQFFEAQDKLLKEQEAVVPKRIVRKQCKTEHSDGSVDYYAEWFCPHCNLLILRGFDNPSIKFCYKCGKPILWEGR